MVCIGIFQTNRHVVLTLINVMREEPTVRLAVGMYLCIRQNKIEVAKTSTNVKNERTDLARCQATATKVVIWSGMKASNVFSFADAAIDLFYS